MEIADDKGNLHHFTYEDTVLDMVPDEKPAPEAFSPVKVEAYREAHWDLGNFELQLYINDKLYHSLDMQDKVNPNDKYLSAGNYSYSDTITDWSNFVTNVETGEGAYLSAAEIELTHNEHETTVTVHQLVQVGASSYGQLDLYIQGVQLAGFSLDYTYRFYDDGTVKIDNQASPQGKLPELLPRIGFTTSVMNSFDNITWYGRGPEENYPDRKTGYPVGIWTKSVADMYEPYLLPQDHALRTDIRYVQLLDDAGSGVQISMNEHFNFNAYQFSTDNLTKSQYTYQLQPQTDCYTLNLDYNTTGVGCTSIYVLDEYRVKPAPYNRTITIKPIATNK